MTMLNGCFDAGILGEMPGGFYRLHALLLALVPGQNAFGLRFSLRQTPLELLAGGSQALFFVESARFCIAPR